MNGMNFTTNSIFESNKRISDIESNMKSRFLNVEYQSSVPLSDIGIDYTQSYYLQGSTMNTNTSEILLIFVHDNVSPALLRIVSEDFSTYTEKSVSGLGHANDVTYNPNTNKYYVADGIIPQTIHELDGSTLDVTRSIIIESSPSNGVSQIAYNDIKNNYIVLDNSRKIFEISEDFTSSTYVLTLSDESGDIGPELHSRTIMGATCINGYYVSPFWRYGITINSFIRLHFIDIENKIDSFIIDIRSQSQSDEAESLMLSETSLVVLGQCDRYLSRYKIDINKKYENQIFSLYDTTVGTCNHIPVNTMGQLNLRNGPASNDQVEYIHFGGYTSSTLLLYSRKLQKYYIRRCEYVDGNPTWGAFQQIFI